MLAKILGLVKQYQTSIFLASCFILISIISFNLGKIEALKKTPIQIQDNANIYQAVTGSNQNQATSNQTKSTIATNKTDLRVVVSKSSTSKKYHFSWCPGASQIKEENKIWFNTEAEAIQAGYTKAANCN